MIKAKNISLEIGSRLILDQVSTQIPLGKVTTILGPNGAGKSTLLKCMTGAIEPDSGTVAINSKPLEQYSLADLSRMRGVLSQSIPVSFPFTAVEIVQMGRTPYSEEESSLQDSEITHQALELVDALPMKDRVFPTLSGGEQQRVQLARVLAQLWNIDNSYLFLDEPTSALDLKHQHQMLALVRKLVKDHQMGICIVIHDLHLAMRYADHVILMKDGKLFSSGNVQQVLTRANIESVFEINASLVFE